LVLEQIAKISGDVDRRGTLSATFILLMSGLLPADGGIHERRSKSALVLILRRVWCTRSQPMTIQVENQFDSIESARDYLSLLAEVLAETQGVIRQDMDEATTRRFETRQIDALKLVDYKLQRLAEHLHSSRRLLNDLRTLRRLLNSDRALAHRRPQ